jgi:hypothetical protein
MTAALVPTTIPRALAELGRRSPAVFLPDAKTAECFFGFFMAYVRNNHTRRAYYKAACRLAGWCEDKGLPGMAHVKPPHVGAYIEGLTETLKMANHADTRTTQLYDRRSNSASLDEYGKVGI